MAKFKLTAVVTLLAGLLTIGARARAVELPPDSIGADTVFIIRADAQHLSPDLLRTAARTILGENADIAKDFLANFQSRYEKVAAAGVESVTVIGTSTQKVADAENELNADPNSPQKRRNLNPPVVYFHLKAGGDVKALEKVMTQDLPEKERADVQFEQMDNWVVMHRKNQTPPDKVDAERTRTFSDALGTIDNAAIGFVVVPDARMKSELTKAAANKASKKIMQETFPVLSNCKWITLSIALGNDPGLTLAANTADAKSASQLKNSVDGALDEIKHPGEDAAGPMLFLGPLLAPMLEDLKPRVNGNIATMSLKGEPLNKIANLIATFRNMVPPK